MNMGLKQVYISHGWELQPLQYPEDKDGDGPQNVGFFAIQPLDVVGSPRRFYYIWAAIYAYIYKTTMH
jgi:hypothetical protein